MYTKIHRIFFLLAEIWKRRSITTIYAPCLIQDVNVYEATARFKIFRNEISDPWQKALIAD
jgi:hypothetical protein